MTRRIPHTIRQAQGRLYLACLPGATSPLVTRAMLFALLLLAPVLAHAQTVSGGTSPATMLNNIATFILGSFGQSLAVLGIAACGVAWMFGRLSLGILAGVVGGCMIMFGASYIVQTLSGSGTTSL